MIGVDAPSAQVDHAPDVGRHVGNLGRGVPAADFLNAQYLDAILLTGEHEGQILIGRIAGVQINFMSGS